jgi:hypothetical protein
VWLLVVPRGTDRLAALQIWFAGGRHRDYLVRYKPARGNPDGEGITPGFWTVRSWTGEELLKACLGKQFDLRHACPTVLGEDDVGHTAWVAGWQDVERDLLAVDVEDLFRGCERHPLP